MSEKYSIKIIKLYGMVIIPFVTHQKQLLAKYLSSFNAQSFIQQCNDYEKDRPPFICVIFIIYSFSCIKYFELIDIEKIFNYLLPLNDEICKLLRKKKKISLLLLIFHSFLRRKSRIYFV